MRIPVDDCAKAFENVSRGDKVAAAWVLEHYVEAEAEQMGLETRRP